MNANTPPPTARVEDRNPVNRAVFEAVAEVMFGRFPRSTREEMIARQMMQQWGSGIMDALDEFGLVDPMDWEDLDALTQHVTERLEKQYTR